MGNNGRFMDGFVMGALIGGAAVFLIGTKKGNKVLKVISEGGLDGLTEMFEDFEEGVEEGIKNTTHDIEKKEAKEIKHIEEKIELEPVKSNGVNHSSTSPRRFFRKAK